MDNPTTIPMIIQSNQESVDLPRIREFFIARQPILGRDQKLVAYELLFRHADIDEAEVLDNLCATASVIQHAAELGIENVIGGALAFFNVDAALLMCDFVKFLPSEKVVLEILETVEITPQLISRVQELAKAGFVFALDDVIAYSPDMQELLPFVKIIKVDIANLQLEQLEQLAKRFKKDQKLLLAEKVETVEQFHACLDFGFDYFQGYYFAKPDVLTGTKADTSKTTIMQLMALILSDAETAEIERNIKEDPSLTRTLLRLVNLPGLGAGQKISSLSEALTVLGRRQLHRWLHIVLYAATPDGSEAVSPLLLMATTRGKLMELIAEKLHQGDRNIASTAFMVGIMSLIDALFGKPMGEILEHFNIAQEVKDALLERKGFYGDLLTLAERVERLQDSETMLSPTLRKLQLSIEELYLLQLQAFEWSNSLAHSVP